MQARRVVLIGAFAAGCVVSVATVVSAAGTPATPGASTPPPKSLTVTATNVSDLFPGAPIRTVNVTVTNPKANTGAVTLSRVTPSVKSQSDPRCVIGIDQSDRSAYDLIFRSYVAPATNPPVLERDGSATVPVQAEFIDRGVNQDVCKKLNLTLNYVATAAGK